MAKKKKIWNTPTLSVLNATDFERISATLYNLANGESMKLSSEVLYDVLNGLFGKIERLQSDEEILQALSLLYNCSGFFDFPVDDEENWENVDALFANAEAIIKEKSANFENREFLVQLMHDVIVSSFGENSRQDLIFSIHEFLSREEMEKVADLVVKTLTEADDLMNANDIAASLFDMADAVDDPEFFEKIVFLADPTRKNASILQAANAYYVKKDLQNAKRLLAEIKNPEGPDEENYLDLKIGTLFMEEKKGEAVALAETLYEKFPQEYHLMSLCNVVTPARKEELLDAHEQFRLGVYVSVNYVHMLATLEEWDRLGRYLDRYEKEIPMMNEEDRDDLAARLENSGKKELAQKLRKA